MRSAVLFIFRSRLLLYSAGSGVNRVQVVVSGFSVDLLILHRILPFVYTFYLHFRWTSEGHPKCRDVGIMGIVTYVWWFQEPDHTRMLCLRWSTYISHDTPCYMQHHCLTSWDISTLHRDYHTPLLNFHPGWQSSCVMPSYACVAFTASDEFCKEVSRSYGANEAFSLQTSLCWNLTV